MKKETVSLHPRAVWLKLIRRAAILLHEICEICVGSLCEVVVEVDWIIVHW